jgi:hypothetical protein
MGKENHGFSHSSTAQIGYLDVVSTSQGYPQWDAEDTDSVLDHMGSLLEGQTLLRPQDIEGSRIEPGDRASNSCRASISRLRNPESLLEL